jgi:hypothetical protein
MATESIIVKVLDTLTSPKVESSRADAAAAVQHRRAILADENAVRLGVAEKVESLRGDAAAVVEQPRAILADENVVRAGVVEKPEVESLSAGAAAPVEHLRAILADENVVGVGVAEKVRKGKRLAGLALIFYVKKKKPNRELPGDLVIPRTVLDPFTSPLPIPIDVVELGQVALDRRPLAVKSPIQPGYSIGHPKCLGGTLGAIVKRGNTTLLLSNAHVIADNGRARHGAPVLYPAIGDKGSRQSDVVAKLDKTVALRGTGEFVNRVDCAVARVTTNKRTVTASVAKIGGPTGTTVAKRSMRIVKVGRTTGCTTGTVRDVHFRFTVAYDGLGQIGFKDQVLCSPYSKNGDSGALVLEKSTRKAVGLHFASSPKGSVFNPISEVLKRLDVKLVMGQKGARSNVKSRRKPRK